MAPQLGVERDVLADMLRSHGEDKLAERARSATEEDLARIGRLAGYYAFSEDAIALGGSMGGTRALALAAIDVLEKSGRDLRWSRTERERDPVRLDQFADDAARDRVLRAQADSAQLPSATE